MCLGDGILPEAVGDGIRFEAAPPPLDDNPSRCESAGPSS